MIIPDAVRPKFYDNMIGGLVMNLAGPEVLKLGFHVFVVIVGVLILSGAVNTSLIGVNGVLNRVAEDGVLIDWFRKPHRKYGTTYRILNTMALLQIATILASRGNVLCSARLTRSAWSGVSRSSRWACWCFAISATTRNTSCRSTCGSASTEIPIGLGITTLRAVPGRHRESLLEADRDHLRRFLHHRAVYAVHDLRADQRQEEEQAKKRSGEVQSGPPAAGERGDPPRAARLRAGGGPRLSTACCIWSGFSKRPICGGRISSS